MPATAAPKIGASQNSQSCDKAGAPTNSAGPVLRAGFTDKLVTGMPIEVDQGEAQTDGDRRESLGCVAVRGAQDNHQEEKRQDELRRRNTPTA